jgi:uncharacterized SAM-binding protein YcdF (DUF218 family)
LTARVWRRWLWRALLLLLALGIMSVGGLALIIVRYGAADRARPADVIIVLGGGATGTDRRARHAAALYAQGYAPYVLCAGNLPVIDAPYNEAQWCAQVAQQHGVPAAAIVLEERSRSTEENAIEAAAIMSARGWQDAILVSDDFHLFRAMILFRAHHTRVWPSPAQATTEGGLTLREESLAVLREIAALGWHAGKSLLGLPYTHVED